MPLSQSDFLADKLRTGAIGTSIGAVFPGIFAFAWAFTGPLGPDGMYDPLRYASFVFTGGLLLVAVGLSIAAAICRRLGERAIARPETQATLDGELDGVITIAGELLNMILGGVLAGDRRIHSQLTLVDGYADGLEVGDPVEGETVVSRGHIRIGGATLRDASLALDG